MKSEERRGEKERRDLRNKSIWRDQRVKMKKKFLSMLTKESY